MYAPQLPHSVSSSAGGGVRLVGIGRFYQIAVKNFELKAKLKKT